MKRMARMKQLFQSESASTAPGGSDQPDTLMPIFGKASSSLIGSDDLFDHF